MLKKKKRKQTHRYREQTNGYLWEEGQGEGQDRSKGLRNTNYYHKINYKNIFKAWGIESIFYNNFKWSMICQNTESLCCAL